MKIKALTLILARGGSQRIPEKNIAKLGGIPLIAHTIRAAKKSKYVSRIVVSTDCPKIAKVANKHGAETPFFRPAEISQWSSTEHEAIKHALDWLKDNERYKPDMIVKLFPTSPFRKAKSIDRCMELMANNWECDSVRSVRKVKEHPYKMWTIRLHASRFTPKVTASRLTPKATDLRLERLIETNVESHTLSYQCLPQIYVNNASIDVTKPETIYKKFSVTGTDIIPYQMSEEESFDINTMQDLDIARFLWRKRR